MLEFKPIDITIDRSTLIANRLDAYICTHGHSDGFLDQIGGCKGKSYLGRLAARIEQIPQGNCLCYSNGELVGQLELKWHNYPNSGYVNLFYLKPKSRGFGLGRELHEKTVEIFQTLGADSILLSVGKNNESAKAFYNKLGWRNLGTRPDKSYADYYEFTF